MSVVGSFFLSFFLSFPRNICHFFFFFSFCVLFIKYQLLLQVTVFINFLTLRFYPLY
ncbi:hypothetical protein HanIR_Chr14g0690151 [Helianthus annuus]|nr:hypothetical protein HanIR_Chr14g0690151 [Helianthus annuus]